MTELSATPITLRTLLTPGVAALRRYWKPFLLLQGLALLLVVGFYASAPINRACQWLSSLHQSGGLLFAAMAAGVAGSLLPEVAKALMLGERSFKRDRLRDMAFAFFVFAAAGILVDLQYWGLAWLIGNDEHFATAIKKMLADQFVLTPIYGIPMWPFAYDLRRNRYRPLATMRNLTPRWYLMRVMPLLIPCWGFWIPMVLLIYSLPQPLQFCLYSLALAAWSLLIVFVAPGDEL